MPLLIQLFRLVRAHLLPTLVAGAVGWSLAHWLLGTFVDHHDRAAGIAVVIAAGLAMLIPYYAILFLTGMRHRERRRMVAWARSSLHPARSKRKPGN
jgi:hypothetical protein